MIQKKVMHPQEMVGQRITDIYINASRSIAKIKTESATLYAMWDGGPAHCRLHQLTGLPYLFSTVKRVQTSKWNRIDHGTFQLCVSIETDIGQADISIVCERDSQTSGDVVLFDERYLTGHPKVVIEEEKLSEF